MLQEQSSPSSNTNERKMSIFNIELSGNPMSMADSHSVRRFSMVPTPMPRRLDSKVPSVAALVGSKSSREDSHREEVGPDNSDNDEGEPSDSSRHAKENFNLLSQNRALKKYPTVKSRAPKRLQELDNTMDEVA